VWNALKIKFASESRARVSNLKRQLQSLNQGSKSCSCSDYLRTAKSWVDTLADIGKSMDDDDLISFIINGLNHTNNSFITSYTLATRANPLSFTDFHDEVVEP
jgi:hypothetical protein